MLDKRWIWTCINYHPSITRKSTKFDQFFGMGMEWWNFATSFFLNPFYLVHIKGQRVYQKIIKNPFNFVWLTWKFVNLKMKLECEILFVYDKAREICIWDNTIVIAMFADINNSIFVDSIKILQHFFFKFSSQGVSFAHMLK